MHSQHLWPLLFWAAAEAVELAVVRPFATGDEVARLERSFDLWNEFEPCGPHKRAPTDLFLVYSRRIRAADGVSATLAKVVSAFEKREQKWHRCFRSIHMLGANLTIDEDVYDHKGQDNNPNWVKGPNAVFRFLLRHFIGSKYGAFFLMEMDALPKRALWLEQYEREALDYPAAAIRGSQYRGYKWNNFLGQLPAAMRMHINGNAIYNTSHPFLGWLSGQLQKEAHSLQDRVPYDVRMAQLTLEAKAAGEALSESAYSSDSRLIGNYANTLLNASFDGGEYVAHGSPENVFAEVEETKVTLAAVYMGEETFPTFEKSLFTPHPFRKVLVLQRRPQDGEVELRQMPSGLTEVRTGRLLGEDNKRALCEAAEQVETELFVFLPTTRMLKAPVSVLVNGTRPLLPFVLAESPFCAGKRSCRESVNRAQQRFKVALKGHYNLYDTVLSTSLARQFCASPEAKEATAALSADDYVAWQMSTRGGLEAAYTEVDRGMKGWRSWSVPAASALSARRLTGNNTDCASNAQNDCNKMPQCMWMANTNSCESNGGTTMMDSATTMMGGGAATTTIMGGNVGGEKTTMMMGGGGGGSKTTMMMGGATTAMPMESGSGTTMMAGASTAMPSMDKTTTWMAAGTTPAPGQETTTDPNAPAPAPTPKPPPPPEPLITFLIKIDPKEIASNPAVLNKMKEGCKKRAQKVASKAACKTTLKLKKKSKLRFLRRLLRKALRLMMKAIGRADGGKAWKNGKCSVEQDGVIYKHDTPVDDGARRLQAFLSETEGRMLAEVEYPFGVETTVEDSTDLEGATPLGDAGFAAALASAIDEEANASNIPASEKPSESPTVDEPNETADVSMAIVASDDDLQGQDAASLQSSLSDPAELLSAIAQETGSSSLITETPSVDRCADRTCGGQGICNNATGTCDCTGGYTGPNCQTAPTTMAPDTTMAPGSGTTIATATAPIVREVPKEEANTAVIVVAIASVVLIAILGAVSFYFYKKKRDSDGARQGFT